MKIFNGGIRNLRVQYFDKININLKFLKSKIFIQKKVSSSEHKKDKKLICVNILNSLLSTVLFKNLVSDACIQELFTVFYLTLSVSQYLAVKCDIEFALISIAMLCYTMILQRKHTEHLTEGTKFADAIASHQILSCLASR